MRTRTQNKVIGTTAEAGFHRGQQERAQEELQFYDSPTVKVEQTTRGVRFHAKVPPVMPPAAGVTIAVFQYNNTNGPAAFGDYLVCFPQKPDGTFDGTQPTKIAKAFLLRNSIASVTVGSGVNAVTYNYAYGSDTQSRTVTWTIAGSNSSEYQIVTPPWWNLQLILAVQMPITGVLDPVTQADVGWMDLNNDGRKWLRKTA